MNITDTGATQGDFKRILVELRIFPRTGKATYIGKDSYAERDQHRNKYVYIQVGMPNRPDPLWLIQDEPFKFVIEWNDLPS